MHKTHNRKCITGQYSTISFIIRRLIWNRRCVLPVSSKGLMRQFSKRKCPIPERQPNKCECVPLSLCLMLLTQNVCIDIVGLERLWIGFCFFTECRFALIALFFSLSSFLLAYCLPRFCFSSFLPFFFLRIFLFYFFFLGKFALMLGYNFVTDFMYGWECLRVHRLFRFIFSYEITKKKRDRIHKPKAIEKKSKMHK